MAQERSNRPRLLAKVELTTPFLGGVTKEVNIFKSYYVSDTQEPHIALFGTIDAGEFAYKDQAMFTKFSVNLVDEVMGEDEVAIKDYAENEGMLKQLIDQGIVSQALRYATSGFVTIPICKLLIQPQS